MAAREGAREHRWSAHPWRARGVRVLVYALPIAVSLAFVYLATSIVRAPTSSLWVFLLWWFAISLMATAVVSVVYGISRRLLPLGALLGLSLVFPDEAPSRFQLALRSGTVETLEARLRSMRRTHEAPSVQEAAEILLQLVGALDVHDAITRGHAERVRAYASSLGRELGLAADDLDRLNWAALLHDIGKLEVSAEILNKPGKPTEEEWEKLRLHPLYGETLVEPLREWLGSWTGAVGYHHERWDGKGYPRGVAGEEIPLAGRIVAIADVFDVITSTRSYKEAMSATDARSEIGRCSGTQFDPRLVRAFVNMSLGRMRLVAGPLSWLTHVPLLVRLPLTPSVGASLGGLATVVTAAATGVVGAPEAAQATLALGARPAPPAVVSSRVDRPPPVRLDADRRPRPAAGKRDPGRTSDSPSRGPAPSDDSPSPPEQSSPPPSPGDRPAPTSPSPTPAPPPSPSPPPSPPTPS
ncbi:MAG: HD-GYP domain-containing protein, partial [Gaiellaceae bacterium]